MTRVNVGIPPPELCDQHLIAECCKELPRCFRPPSRRIGGQFRLGKGHVLWCQQYQRSLALRHRRLVIEMLHRNFTVTRPDTPDECFDGAEWSLDDELYAIPKVRARIVQRLCGLDDYGHFTGKMRSSQNPKNWPRWTNRNTPDWADK